MSMELSAFCAAVREERLAVRGVRVYQNGVLTASYQPEPERRQDQYSGTKSFVATACAFALKEGLFRLEDTVLAHFAADAPAQPSARLCRMKLVHLLTMTMGFAEPLLMGESRYHLAERDWVKYVLRAEVTHEPGAVFQYNNAGPYLLSVLIQRKTGMSLVDYLMPRLFQPLGIERPECENDPLGYSFGASGLQLTVSEFAKLGLLYLQDGCWDGKRILPEGWVAQASQPRIQSDRGDDEIGQDYGYLFWNMPDGAYRADGKQEQYCIVWPRKNAVVAVNSAQTEGKKKVLHAVVRTIFPLL